MQKLAFTEEEWGAAMPRVVADMKAFLSVYRTPVFEDFGDHGDGWGTGSYIRLEDRIFVLTNAHVATVRRDDRNLLHQLLNNDNLHRIVGNHVELPWPEDLGILPVSGDAWATKPNASRAIELDQIMPAHNPVPSELLTFTGFSGQETGFHFNTLHAVGTCYTAREVALPADQRFGPHYHFGIDYRPDAAIPLDGRDLPLPPGLSGSSVWNTRFVEARLADVVWSPEMARLTGVVWGWPSSARFLVATRAEHVCRFLEEAKRAIRP
jgi:hypothetical protein